VTVQTEARYADLTQLPGVTGSAVQRQMATLKARLIARYRLHTVPGRPEELVFNVPTQGLPQPQRVVSLAYGCGGIRIRKHGGTNNRDWVSVLDLQPRDGWHAEVYHYLDEFFGVGNAPGRRPAEPEPVEIPVGNVSLGQRDFGQKPLMFETSRVGQVPRPIRDHPQA
jgi:hypothetical protein